LVAVYLPPSFKGGEEYDTIVVLDEDVYAGPVPLRSILDYLIGIGAMRPTVDLANLI
jgi:enterochelin esterase-like enzyme